MGETGLSQLSTLLLATSNRKEVTQLSAKIIQFAAYPKRDSNDYDIRYVNGLNMPPLALIGKSFSSQRKHGTDTYLCCKFNNDGSVTELFHGYVPTQEEQSLSELRSLAELQRQQRSLIDQVSSEAWPHIKDDVKRNFHTCIQDNYSFVFVPCSDGIVGTSWYDNEGTRKGLFLAAFLAYALGWLNSEHDEVLWSACYEYLIYDDDLRLGFGADQIIKSFFYEQKKQ